MKRLPFIFILVAMISASAVAQEIRAMWVDTFHAGLRDSTETTALIAAARAAKCNAVFVEVRKRGDAYYRNGIEPTAADVAAGFDPLADLILRGHTGTPRVEVHAWVVTYNIWNNETAAPTQPTHPYNLHPDWLTRNSAGATWVGAAGAAGNYMLDPGHPEVQQHTYDVCMDIVSRYDVDGLHFDYVRYPDYNSSGGNQPWGYHPLALARFQKQTGSTGTPAATNASWLQWRRNQVTALVRKVYLNTWALKPGVRVSAALIVYGSAPTSLSLTSWQSSEAYARVLQDWRGWMEEGILDLACPMIYGTDNTRFDNWADFAKDRKYSRACAPGMGWYLNTVANTITQIGLARDTSANGNTAAGMLGYSYAVPNSNAVSQDGTWASLVAGPFSTDVSVPAMPWKTNVAKGHAMGTVRASDTGGALDGAIVTLTGPSARTLTTDATGFFGAVDLPVGSYTASIAVPGFQPFTGTFIVSGGAVVQPATQLDIVPFVITANAYSAAGKTVAISWNSVPGRSYRVEQSQNLAQWTTTAAGVAAIATSTSHVWTIPSGWTTRGFLRVALE